MQSLESVWKRQDLRVAALVAGLAAALYTLTCAPGTLFGDPSEYQFIPAIWGIAHPPGYAFYTLLAGVWQRLIPIGTVAYRTNLLSCCAGAWTAACVYLSCTTLLGAGDAGLRAPRATRTAAALLASLSLIAASDHWQHSIHANAHIVSAALTATQITLMLRWWREPQDRWLAALAFIVGLGVTHHPITVFGLPAMLVLIVLRKPELLRRPLRSLRTIAVGLGSGVSGLLPWLYFPLRSPSTPFGPTNMRTWEGFYSYITAQGLRVNLFHFGLGDQLTRARVFLSLLRLQYAWPLLLLAVVGAVVVASRHRLAALGLGLFLLVHLAFTLNTVQDVMAYLLHPFHAVAVLIGIGGSAIIEAVLKSRLRWLAPLAIALLLLVPVATLLSRADRISLREWRDADKATEALLDRFAGKSEGAAYLSDWEHLTPYLYQSYVEGVTVPEEDLRASYVSPAFPWPESVFANLPLGPVYLSGYRRDIVDLGFRLRPAGDIWQVWEPPATGPVSPEVTLTDAWADSRLEVLGYDLPQRALVQGDTVPLVLYARIPVTETDILMPYARLGELEQRWTTDSRQLTPSWRPGEIIAERYTLYIPYNLPAGEVSLRLGYTDMTSGRGDVSFTDGSPSLNLGFLTVKAAPGAAQQARMLATSITNIGNEVALESATARVGSTVRRGLWEVPLEAHPGDMLYLDLHWQALTRPRTSVTVFIHLIDAAGRPWFGHDYTPLGGSFPSYLWFPKWLEGQRVLDPYRLALPQDLPAGQYWLEVGLYEMASVRRLPQFDKQGMMVGDRCILGPVSITAE